MIRPQKPRKDFPLYWHKRGYWMCKRQGREMRYTADAEESERLYNIDEENRKRGHAERDTPKGYSLGDAINLFWTRLCGRHADGKLSDVQIGKYRLELQKMLPKAISPKTPLHDFRCRWPGDNQPAELFKTIRLAARRRGPSAASRHIVIVRALFRFAAKRSMMLAPDYLDEFDPPPKHELDSHRESRDREYGERAWTIAELRRIIAEAGRLGEYRRAKSGRKLPPRNPHLHAQILLALFGAFGSDDLSAMPKISVDLKTGLIRFPRVKIKGRPRACFIPRRVVDAIYSSLAHRRGDGNLLFATMAGQKCNAAKVRSDELGPLTASRNDTIGKNFSRMVRRIGLAKKRTGFKTLRAMCRTMMLGADIDPDLIAVIMGRKLRFPIDEFYLRGEMREKLMKVARHIERQLFSKSKRVG